MGFNIRKSAKLLLALSLANSVFSFVQKPSESFKARNMVLKNPAPLEGNTGPSKLDFLLSKVPIMIGVTQALDSKLNNNWKLYLAATGNLFPPISRLCDKNPQRQAHYEKAASVINSAGRTLMLLENLEKNKFSPNQVKDISFFLASIIRLLQPKIKATLPADTQNKLVDISKKLLTMGTVLTALKKINSSQNSFAVAYGVSAVVMLLGQLRQIVKK